MAYWFNDFMAFEEKEIRTNRLALSFRYWSEEETRTAMVYLNQNIRLPSEPLDERQVANILYRWKKNPILNKTPLTFYIPQSEGYLIDELEMAGCQIRASKTEDVLCEVEMPFNKALIKKFEYPRELDRPGQIEDHQPFQAANFNKLVREQMDCLNRKVEFDEKFDQVFNEYERIEKLQGQLKDLIENYTDKPAMQTRVKNLFYGYVHNGITHASLKNFLKDEPLAESLKRQMVKAFRTTNAVLQEIDSSNFLGFEKSTAQFEINLNSTEGITFLEDRINAEEFRQQVFCYFDIERPLYRLQGELELLKERERLLKKKTPKAKQQIAAIDEVLQFEVDGKNYNLADYPDEISWVGMEFKLHDGTYVEELHTIRETGLEEVNGCPIFMHKTQKDLLNAVFDSMREKKTYVTVAHNSPYDTINLREEARKTKSRRFVTTKTRKEPRKTVSIDFYTRLAMPSQEVIDTMRLAIVFHPYLRGKMPYGNHTLKHFFSYLHPDEKPLDKTIRDELRSLEVRTINGDLEAARIIADYAEGDVDPLRLIVEEHGYIETVMRMKKYVPNAPITELFFSPSSIQYLLRDRHSEIVGNQYLYGRESFLHFMELDESKKWLQTFKKSLLKEAGINVSPARGRFKATQVYVPIELFTRELLEFNFPKWREYFTEIEQIPDRERFAALQYPKAFLNDVFSDYYFFKKEADMFVNYATQTTLSSDELNGLLRKMYLHSPRSFKNLYRKYNRMHSLFGSFLLTVENSEAKQRVMRSINKRRRKVSAPQIGIESNFLADACYELDNLRHMGNSVRTDLSDSAKNVLQVFRAKYSAFDRYFDRTVKDMVPYIDSERLTPKNIVFLYLQRKRVTEREQRFKKKWGLFPSIKRNDNKTFEELLNDAYGDLAKQLRKTRVLLHRGDYLFIDGPVPESVVPIREVSEFIPKPSKKAPEDQLQFSLASP